MQSADQKTILLVEDEMIVAMHEKASLEKCGYIVISAHNSQSALTILETIDNIDIILMDVDLGDDIDGTDLAKKILEIYDLPILFLSSYSDQKIVEQAEAITPYGYIIKDSPVSVMNASIRIAFKLFETDKRLLQEQAARQHSDRELRRQFYEQQQQFKEGLHLSLNNIAMLGVLVNPNETSEETIWCAAHIQRLYEHYLNEDQLGGRFLREYLSLLKEMISGCAGTKSIEMRCEVSDVGLESRQVYPLYIIIHELVANAVIHAFRDRRQGCIDIRLEKNGNATLLEVFDDGCGFADGFDPKAQKTNGLRTVYRLAQFLQAAVECHSDKGTRWVFNF